MLLITTAIINLFIGIMTIEVYAMQMTINNNSNMIPPRRENINTISISRRDIFHKATLSASIITGGSFNNNNIANAADSDNNNINPKQIYNQRFPTLFDPFYGQGVRRTIKRQIGPNIWSLEQNLQIGPLQTPLRCVVIQLDNGSLWVHAPLAPTLEFFELVESCCAGTTTSDDVVKVGHIVVPSYALEHKVFVKDALQRWPNAQLWTSPNQFSFPVRSTSSEFVFGKKNVDGILSTMSDEEDDMNSNNNNFNVPSWTNEIQYETLAAGTFNIAGSPTTFYETAFFHKKSKSLIVTDAVAKISTLVPELNDPNLLLLVSKRSTSDPQPDDTYDQRLIGWEKTALLVSYFFPEHEEFDPDKFGVVTWTEGWHDNFERLSNQLLVPPVVRTLLYSQDPMRVKEWVHRVSDKWDFEQIVPAHFEAPIKATPSEFKRTFAFLDDDTIDAFPENDLARGLKPISDLIPKVR